MGKVKEKKGTSAKKKNCYICGELLAGGVMGEDIHYVKAKYGQERYYCGKCMQKLLRGEI